MNKQTLVKIKICCIKSIEEAQLAIRYGADAIGLVGPMPSGPGIIEDEMIKRIAANVPSGINTFLLTSQTSAQGIIDHHHKTKTKTIQMVDAIPFEELKIVRAALPDVELVQVIHVINKQTLEKAQAVAPFVDAILLDSGNPDLKTKELGGTGRVHNWEWSKKIVEEVEVPVFLAGGLNAENVQAAIKKVKPFGVDLCSGLRTEGNLDERKLSLFIDAIQSI